MSYIPYGVVLEAYKGRHNLCELIRSIPILICCKYKNDVLEPLLISKLFSYVAKEKLQCVWNTDTTQLYIATSCAIKLDQVDLLHLGRDAYDFHRWISKGIFMTSNYVHIQITSKIFFILALVQFDFGK